MVALKQQNKRLFKLAIIVFALGILIIFVIIWYNNSDIYKTDLSSIKNNIKDNLDNRELVKEIFCNLDDININPTTSIEYNNLKKAYFNKYELEFRSCRK